MKNLILILLAVVFLYYTSGCEELRPVVKALPDKVVVEVPKDPNATVAIPEGSIESRQLVVRIPPGLSEEDINEMKDKIRSLHPFDDDLTQTCSCGSKSIQLWTFDTSAHAEGAVGSLKDQGNGSEGENQFIVTLPEADGDSLPEYLDDSIIDSTITSLTLEPADMDGRLNIAVIDTGIDFKKINKADTEYLYNTEDLLGCTGSISGWNFDSEAGDGDITYNNEHGPIVTKIITSTLDAKNVPYSILPVKAFDSEGKSSYWKIVCAMNYIREVHLNSKPIHLVNASFGYDFVGLSVEQRNLVLDRQNILKDLIDELNATTIVVASSGNEDYDTDQPEFAHFPSGFDSENLVGVGGYEIVEAGGFQTYTTNVVRGNYGTASIDMAARFNQQFTINVHSGSSIDQQLVTGLGTSFGTAFATAKLGDLYFNTSSGSLPLYIKTSFLNSPEVDVETGFLNFFVDGKYIPQ